MDRSVQQFSRLKKLFSFFAICFYFHSFNYIFFRNSFTFIFLNVWEKILPPISCLFYLNSLRVLLNRAPTSTQLPPPPPSSIHLHPPPPSSFQPPPSSLQHPQKYLNQNIARNWGISPNLGQKIKSCPFWLKIGTHVILEVLIPNQDLDF